jgi:EAL domain-containing protein (putative c-di-GMP-specific phosphodiesterase class I)/PAS domain-containing protein
VLVVLILVVELLIFQAYANVNRTTAIFGQQSFLNSSLVNAQREAVLLEDQIEDLPTKGDLKGVTVRRGLLGNQLFQIEGQGGGDPEVAEALRQVRRDLALVDRHLASVRADPSRANVRAQVAVMLPVAHRLTVSIKQLFDTEEQGLFDAVNGALDARTSSERLLIGLSGLVLVVGLALARSLRQRVRNDFARAYETLTAEVEERKATERARRASEERFRSLVQNSSDVISIVDADGGVRYHSESVRRVLGYDPADLLDGDPLTLVHPDDQLLVAAARRLQGCLRPTDTAARLGGDEFGVLLERVTDAEAAAVAGRVLDTLHQPFGLNGRTIPIKASLGVAAGRAGVDEATELLRNADVAMYAAKAGGKDGYEVFHPDMHEDMLQRLELEAELRHVADRDQLVLHYQPIVELVSGRVTRVEALVRWDHPTKGLLPPGAFVPLAEEQGLIGPIGDWVLLQACLQVRRWQDQFPDAPPLAVHVNLSGRQLEEPRLAGEVARALETSRLSPRLLTLEITESVLVTDIEAMSGRLRELKGLGVHLAIDDVGTGYSSLSYLRRFPVDMLKVDKAFVDGIGRGREDAALAHAIIKLGHTLQLHTVAEGIEEAEQAAHLAAHLAARTARATCSPVRSTPPP